MHIKRQIIQPASRLTYSILREGKTLLSRLRAGMGEACGAYLDENQSSREDRADTSVVNRD